MEHLTATGVADGTDEILTNGGQNSKFDQPILSNDSLKNQIYGDAKKETQNFNLGQSENFLLRTGPYEAA
jgi:hypothetical protein